MTSELRKHSAGIIDGPSRAGARAMYKAVGYDDEALSKPLIGIANTWTEIGPCNFHLRRLAEFVKQGVREAGGTPMEYNTITVSDGITMGVEGMKASLISREVLADSIELVARGHMLDGLIAMTGCDKTTPGAAMALGRLDIPSLIFYGGSIMPGKVQGRDITIQDVYEAIGAHAKGNITDAQLKEMEDNACPGAGSCGGQFTANTMASIGEAIGMSLPGSASAAAIDSRRSDVAFASGTAVMNLLREGIRPRDIMTKGAFENAIAVVMALGGSTNAVLHLRHYRGSTSRCDGPHCRIARGGAAQDWESILTSRCRTSQA